MIAHIAGRYLSCLLATTFIVGPYIGATAKDGAAPATARDASAQAIQLDTITVESKKRARRRTTPAAAPAAPPPAAPPVTTNAGGDIGYHANSTSSATKTNTPLRDIPQSITVVTKQQVQDIGAQRIEDAVRYVPGVNWHQGEGNRDQIVIRGQSSTADFFVNGMRDDGQVYRDLYNTERLEFLKGPNAMIFGRGGGGGVLNRVLKEADGVPINEWKVQTGSYNNARVSADVGGKIADNVYGRINGVYEDTDTYRDFGFIKRGGVNPMLTWLATPLTKATLSYEYFRDQREADRGIASLNGFPYPGASPASYFGNPLPSQTHSTQNIATAMVEHDFNGGLTVKSQTRFGDYKRSYQNIYAGSAVSPITGTYTMAAYNNSNDRQNIMNQTDWTYRFTTAAVKHTMVVGTEFGNQKSANERFTGFFANGTAISDPVPASSPTSFQNASFIGQASDARNQTNLNLAAVYLQDQIELTRWLQFIGGIRFDRFDLSYVNRNGQSPALGQTFAQTDNVVSPRAGVVVKPIDPLSLYASYSISYLPASGDQFGALTPVTSTLMPEKFTNKEIGSKWDITPLLTFTTALFKLDRENTPIRDPGGTGIVVAAGHSQVKGIEAGLAGYLTDKWQISAGYANLHARFVTDTANTGTALVVARAGNHVPFVPTHTYSLWNRYDITYNWGVGVGVIAQDRYYAAADNAVQVPGFTRVDGAIFWRLNKFVRAQLNVENIFGAKYYPSADGNNNITIGSPRAARLVLTANFTGDDRSAPMWGPEAATLFRPTATGPAGPAAIGPPRGTY